LYYMIITAFKSELEFWDNPFGIPLRPTLENFIDLMVVREFYKPLMNTIILTFTSTILGIVITIFASYAYAKMKFKGSDYLFSTTIALTAMPAIVVIIPLYVTMARLNLLNTFTGASIIYAAFMLPLSIFILTSFFKTVDNEIIDAAKIDGCGQIGILFRIMVPLSVPSLVTLFIINGLWVWNEFLIALIFLQDKSKRTIVVEMGIFVGKLKIYPTLIMAGSFFIGVPIIIFYLIGQRYFIKGLTSGAIK